MRGYSSYRLKNLCSSIKESQGPKSDGSHIDLISIYLVVRVTIVLRESSPLHASSPCPSFGIITNSQDGSQLGGCFLLCREHPVLTNHVASLLPWPGSRLFPSVRLAAHDITGSHLNHNGTLLGTEPISFPPQPIRHSMGQFAVLEMTRSTVEQE